MEPFAVHCTTCRARLVVRDPAAIGQILACPRCASMVLVEPPKGDAPSASAGASTPSPQVVRPRDAQHRAPRHDALGIADTVPDAFGDLDELLAARSASGESAPADRAASSARTDLPSPVAVRAEHGSELREQQARTTHRTDGVDPDADTAERLASEPATALAQVTRWSPATIVVGAGVVGIVLAVSASLLLILGFGRNPAQVTQGTGNGSDSQDADAKSDDTEHSAGPTAPTTEATETREPTDGGPDAGATPPGKPNSQVPPIKPDGPGTPEENRPPADDPAQDGGAKPGATPQDGAKGKSPTEANRPEFSPKPNELRRPLPALGGKFADVLNNAPLELGPRLGDTDIPKPPDDDGSGVAGEKPSVSPAVRTALPRPLSREIDVPARLADPLASVTYQSVPLLDFVYEVSDLSTIPITIDLNALRLRQLSVAAPITAKLEASTVEQLLAAALEPLKLVSVVDADSQLVISVPRDDASSRSATYPIEDVTGGEGSRVDALVGLITTFAAPDTWTAAGGTSTIEAAAGQLTIEGPDITHLETQFLLEKIRAAHKLKPLAKPPFAPSLIGPDSVRTRGAEKLALTLKLNFGRPTRLTTILQRLSRDTGTRIVANWQSLASIGWTTETQAMVTVDGKTLDETLVALLEPMELTYRVVDDVTLEVLARQTASALLDVEFHTVADLVQGDADPLIRRLETELGVERFAASGGTAIVRFDAPTKCLVAAAPYDLQRRLSQVLAAWRAEGSKESGEGKPSR